MPERRESKREFASTLIDLTDNSRLRWIKLLDLKSLTLVAKHFAKRGWFFVYRQRSGEHYVIVSSGIELPKDLPAKASYELME